MDLAVGFGRAFGFTCAAVVVLLTADELVRQTDTETDRYTSLKCWWVVW